MSHTHLLSFLLTAASVSLSGCATLNLSPAEEAPETEAALTESPEVAMFRAVQMARQNHSIVLQVRGVEKPLRVIPLPEDGATVFMSDLVRQSGLSSKFGSMDITLFRSSEQELDGVKMAVTVDKSGRVNTGTDYALRAGDRIVIRRGVNTAISGVLDGILPPMVTRR